MKRRRNARQNLLTREEAERLFESYADDLIKSVHVGWEKWTEFEKEKPEFRLPLDDRARANVVHCHIVHDAKARFAGVEGIEVFEDPGYPVFFKFEDRALLRFKKLSRRLETSNYPTQRQVRLQNQQLDLPGMPPALTHVALGYCLDTAGESIEHIAMVCWRNGNLEWSLRLGQPMDNLLPNIVVPSTPPKKKVTVRSKSRKAKNHG